MIRDLPELLSVNRFCQATGKDRQTVRDMCRDGKIPADKIGKQWFIPRDLVFRNSLAYESRGDAE